MTKTPAERGGGEGPHADLARMALGCASLTLALILSHYVVRAILGPDEPWAAACALAAACTIGFSATYMLHRAYGVPRITAVAACGSALMILSQLGNLLENLPLPQFLLTVPTFNFAHPQNELIKSALLICGVGLFFVSFYMSMSEAEKAKQRLGRQARELERRVGDQKRAEEALKESERKYRILAENSADAIWVTDEDMKTTYVSPAVQAIVGRPADEVMAMSPADLLAPSSYQIARAAFDERIALERTGKGDNKPKLWVFEAEDREGRQVWVELTSTPLRDDDGRFTGTINVVRDVTARKRAEEARRVLEEQMLQAQKLESLGVLAGGIAHDFNNLLMGVLGNADLAMMDLPPESPVRETIRRIETAALRAADLTQQMLAYSGRGQFVVGPVNLSSLIKGMAHLLEVSVPKGVAIRYEFDPDLPLVQGDATQLRQVVMNLVTNAAEAMGDKEGPITVRTAVVDATREQLAATHIDDDLPAGRYAALEVIDTGCGMDAKTIERICDPFFTTKFTGRGLGLAAVLGIVRGHRGALRVQSEPGSGSVFQVWYPAAAPAPEQAEPRDAPATKRDWRSAGTILLVDDEDYVRDVGRRMLEHAGFRVITAADGHEAVRLFHRHARDIVGVVLDLTMPHMDGQVAFLELRRIRDDVPVILSSGYGEQAIQERFHGLDIAGFVQKPYQAGQLIEKIHAVLGS